MTRVESTAAETDAYEEGKPSTLPQLPSTLVGARIGPFIVRSILGSGGMGMVLEAEHPDGRVVALKLMTSISASAASRFAREARALAALSHPHVVRFVDAGESPRPWLAMDFVAGRDLQRILRGEELAPDDAARLIAEVARGIAHAHRQGIVHRDLKPANVLVRDADGRALVSDFGLAKELAGERLTKTGALLGTLSYMSPEQVAGRRDVGPPTDVWAIGAILYRCLCGREPFEAPNQVALASKVADGAIVPPSKHRAGIPRDLEATCLACLERDPARRPSAGQVAQALRQRRGLASRSRRRTLVGVGLLLLAVGLGALGFALADPQPVASAPADPAGPPSAEPIQPWAPADAGWERVWRLGDGPPPRLEPAALWRDAAGREAAPLAALRDPAGLAQAFLGEARWRDEGRIAVQYRDLARAVSVGIDAPAAFLLLGAPPAGQPLARDGALQLLSPNDAAGITVRVGRARWRAASVELDLRRVKREDADGLELLLGHAGPGDARPARLALYGRTGRAQVDRDPRREPVALGEAWLSLRFAPGHPAGERVQVDGRPTQLLDQAAEQPAPEGGVALRLLESQFAFARLEVEGEVTRPDLPAAAWIAGALPSSARVAAAFAQEGPGSGGPFLALGPPGAAGLRLELDAGELRLSRHGHLVARARAAGASGWLALERRDDRVRATFAAEGGERCELELLDPLPLGAPLRASYGSTAPAVHFRAVEVHAGQEDPERRALEAGATRDGAKGLGGRTAAGRWRLGALGLARLVDAHWGDPSLRGARARAARLAAARRAAELLASAAAELTGPRGEDAWARACLAWILAAESEAAAQAARELLARAGSLGAHARVDGLERRHGRPVLMKRLVRGYATLHDPPAREAGLAAASVLAPQREGEIARHLANTLRSRRPRPDPRSPAGRATWERVLQLFARARELGETGMAAEEADACMELGRFPQALELWERHLAREPNSWWGWLRQALCLAELKRLPAALESSLGSLAAVPNREDVRRITLQLAQANARSAPGRAACALLALGRLQEDPNARRQLLAQAAQLAGRVAPDASDRETDLAIYVLVSCGEDLAGRARGTRPGAVLARAAAGDPQARAQLSDVAAADSLVRHLARLDPDVD